MLVSDWNGSVSAGIWSDRFWKNGIIAYLVWNHLYCLFTHFSVLWGPASAPGPSFAVEHSEFVWWSPVGQRLVPGYSEPQSLQDPQITSHAHTLHNIHSHILLPQLHLHNNKLITERHTKCVFHASTLQATRCSTNKHLQVNLIKS